jgi:DNA-binding response OmpR family regulator
MEVVVSTPTVLLLERDVTVRYPLAEYLRECGYKVFEARAAEDANKLLDACVCGIGAAVISVRAVGDANAFYLAKRIRANHADAHVVVVGTTAAVADHVAALCFAADPSRSRAGHKQQILHRTLRLRQEPALN